MIKKWAGAQGLGAGSYEIYSIGVAVIDSTVVAGQARLERQGVPYRVLANAGISASINTSVRADLGAMAQTSAPHN